MLEMILSRRYVPVLVVGLFGSAAALGNAGNTGELSEKDYLEEFPVVYSATRLPQPLADAPASITVIDREMIQRTGARSVAELMRLVPGFLVSYFDGAARPYATYHGDYDAYNRHLQVFVDGRTVYSGLLLGSATYGLLAINLEEIERIEVVRGANSASQGANAFSGVINITTRHADDTHGGSVMLGSGDHGLADGSARLGWGNEQASYRLSVSNRRDNGFDNRYDNSDRTIANLRADFRPNARDEYSLTAGHFGFDWGSDVGPRRDERYRSDFVQLRWRRSLEQNSELRVGVFADEEQYGNVSIGNRIDGRVRRVGADAQHLFSPLEQVRVVWGGEYRGDEINSPYLFATAPDQGNRVMRGFGNIEWRASERWLLNLGALWEKHSIVGTHHAPRLAVNFTLAPGHTLRAAATSAFKTPNQFESRANWTLLGKVATGGAKPERVDSSELGYVGEFRSLGLSVDVRGFIEKVRSVLDFGGPGGSDIVNLYPNRQQGWETQLRWQPRSTTQVLVNHTQLRLITDVDVKPEWVKRVPRHYSTIAWFEKLPWDMELGLIHSMVESYYIISQSRAIPAYRQTDIRLAKGFRWSQYRGELALNVLAAEGGHTDYQKHAADGVIVDRRAFVTLKVEF